MGKITLCMLHEERGLTYSTCNTIVHGLRFFYGTTLGRVAMHFVIPLAKEPSTLPVILSRHDIRQLLAAAESLRDQTLLKVTYNAGLRASEVVHLKIAHIDSHRTNPAMTSVTPVCTLADLILYAPTRTALIAVWRRP